MKNFPSKKAFQKQFFSEKGKHIFTLQYGQASVGEYFEFFEKTEKERELFLIETIISQIPLKFHEKILKKIFPEYLPKWVAKLDLEEICIQMISEMFMTNESIFSKIHEKKSKKSAQDGINIPSATLSLVCEKYNISVIDVVEKLTLEQFLWLQDGVMFLLNAQTEEGQKENRYALSAHKKSSTNWEDIKKQFENVQL